MPLQNLLLRDLTNTLGLLVTHLDYGNFITACDAGRNLFALGLNIFGRFD